LADLVEAHKNDPQPDASLMRPIEPINFPEYTAPDSDPGKLKSGRPRGRPRKNK
jgi:hypothetical protein